MLWPKLKQNLRHLNDRYRIYCRVLTMGTLMRTDYILFVFAGEYMKNKKKTTTSAESLIRVVFQPTRLNIQRIEEVTNVNKIA